LYQHVALLVLQHDYYGAFRLPLDYTAIGVNLICVLFAFRCEAVASAGILCSQIYLYQAAKVEFEMVAFQAGLLPQLRVAGIWLKQ
jgi:hypothetical protein